MINRETAFSRAFEEQKANLNRKNAEYNKALESLKAKNIRIDEIDRTLKAVGTKIGLTVLSGDKNELDRMQKLITALSDERQAILEKNGLAPPKFDCNACKDTGYIDGKICDCIKSRAKAILIDELSKSLPLNSCCFDNFSLKYYSDEDSENGNPRKRMEGILKLCHDYVRDFSPRSSGNILFMGDAGLGKTHLSLSIVYELLNQGFDVVYGSAYNLFSAMENEHFNLRSDVSYKAAVECDLLVIDDLGGEFVSPYIQSLLYNIVNTRLLASRPTIISTNLSMADIESRYTPRVSSRLISGYITKKFLGNDIRQIKAMNKNK